ncbi:MAG: putative porin [Kiritimatiellia bacterium]
MMKQGRIGLLAWLTLCGVSLAQTAPNNEQLVQSFRALLSSGSDTQAVINAVADAIREAMKQGPVTAEQAQAGAMAAAPAAAPAALPPKTWADSIVWKGDVRYRTELRKDRGANTKDPNGNAEYDRLRARIGLEAQLNENIKAGVRLATDGIGSGGKGVGGDPQSGNQDMNNGASKKPIFLDLGYIDWNLFGPDNSELHAVFGKMANPFITMNDDLVWDPDTTPEGVAVKGVYDLSPVTLLGNAGYLVLNNNNSVNGYAANDQIILYGSQGAVKYEFCPEVSITMGISDYYYNNIKDAAANDFDVMGKLKTTGSPTFYGNDMYSTTGGKTTNSYFLTGFNVVQPFVSLDMYPTVCGQVLPVSVFAQGVKNMIANNRNMGEMVGFTVGKAKNPQTFEFGATYAKLQRNATLGMWTDSDRWGGGTDGSGYKLYGKYMILKYLMGSVTYFNDSKGIASNDGLGYNRWQFDLTASF